MRLTVLAAAAAGLFLSATAAKASDCGDISIAEMNWPSAELLANIDAIILEEGYGCDVTLLRDATTTTFASMDSKGKPDVAPELWVNALREPLDKAVAAGRLHSLREGPITGMGEGWYVTKAFRDAHPELDTVEKVMKRPDLFPHPEDRSKGGIMGCPSGWGCQPTMINLFRAFEMEKKGWRLIDPGSAAGIDGAVAKASERGQNWIGYYWSPTSIVVKYQLHRLRFETPWGGAENWDGCIAKPEQECLDPKPSSWTKSEVHTVVTDKTIKAGGPAVAYLAKRVVPGEAMDVMLGYMIENQAAGEDAAYKFLEDYPEIWTQWVAPGTATKIKKKL